MRRINFLIGCLLFCLFVLPATSWAQGPATCYSFTGSGAATVFTITVQTGQGSTKSFDVVNSSFGLGILEIRDDGATIGTGRGHFQFSDGSSFYAISDSVFKPTDDPDVFSWGARFRIVAGTGALRGVFDGRMVFPSPTTRISPSSGTTIPNLRGTICTRGPYPWGSIPQ